MTYRSTADRYLSPADRYLSPADRQARELEGRAALAQSARELEAKLRAEAPHRTAASKPGILATLDALQVSLDNLRGAVRAAHVFDVRHVGDYLRTALVELDRAEARVVRDSGLEVREA